MKKLTLFLLMISLGLAVSAQQEPQTDSLKQYTGKYKFPEGTPFTEVTVSLDKGVLTASSAMGSSELKKTEGDVFEVVAYGGTATFKRNAENKIIAVHILVSDIDAVGTKDEEGKIKMSGSSEIKRR